MQRRALPRDLESVDRLMMIKEMCDKYHKAINTLDHVEEEPHCYIYHVPARPEDIPRLKALLLEKKKDHLIFISFMTHYDYKGVFIRDVIEENDEYFIKFLENK